MVGRLPLFVRTATAAFGLLVLYHVVPTQAFPRSVVGPTRQSAGRSPRLRKRIAIIQWSTTNQRPDNLDSDLDQDEPATTTTTSRPRRQRRGPVRFAQITQSVQQYQEQQQATAQIRQSLAQQDPTLLANATYEALATSSPPLLSSSTFRALHEICGVNQMTVVQASTFALARTGWSLLVRSKTGTGKTLAALVPLIERILEDEGPSLSTTTNSGISLLVVAPTRELAQQIASTARDVLTYSRPTSTSLTTSSSSMMMMMVQVVYGGTSLGGNVRQLERQLPRILVATPGRLVELLDCRIRGRPFSQVLLRKQPQNLPQQPMMVWLDEADLLLESFGSELTRLLTALPRKRQTLLCSATLPAKRFLIDTQATTKNSGDGGNRNSPRRQGPSLSQVLGEPIVGFQELDCCGGVAANHDLDESVTSVTKNSTGNDSGIRQDSYLVNVNVEEYAMAISSMEDYLSTLVSLLKQEMSSHNSTAKIVVFFPATKLVQCMAQVVEPFLNAQGRPIKLHYIHSRMSQARRQRASLAFGQENHNNPCHQILFTSDVSARGMDYPNVTLVIQYGMPNSRALYLHRLGRTARAGQYGKGLLVALPFERKVGRRRWIQRMTEWKLDGVNNGGQIRGGEAQEQERPRLFKKEWIETAQAAYKAFAAYYVGQGHAIGTVLEASNAWASSVGLTEIPDLPDGLLEQQPKAK
ncbi:hypothetical protein ACA910_018909 [Epithemia clementina (nom. ined.)]